MMKYKIVQNGGFLILSLILAVVNCIQYTKITRNLHEFCLMNRQDYGIGLDENFELNLKSYSNLPNRIHNSKAVQKSKGRCYIRFYSLLPASHFSISIANMKIPKCKGECQCNYFEISELGYKTKYCGESNSSYFESKTNNIFIHFMHSRHLTFEVAINFTVERNTYIRNGPPGQRQFIESPYFPSDYPPDYTAEYILQNFDPDGYILLLFLDFDMSQLSYVEVKGHNGSHVDKYDGSTFRPPAIVSVGNDLSFKFSANDQLSHSKFRAICFFEKNFDWKTRESPKICGNLFDTLGGMMEISTREKNTLFDCIWRLKRPLYSSNNSSFLSVYIFDFKNIGRRASLEFREGLYSNSRIKESFNCNISNCTTLERMEIIVPAAHGLFIRFNGYLNSQSTVKLSFSIFHSGDCAETEFSCANGRCIQLQLHCDGLDHCTDGSDEQNCTSTTSAPRSSTTTASWWMPQQPYSVENGAAVEKRLSAASASGFLVILMVGVVGVALVAVAVAVVLCRRKRAAAPPPIAMTHVLGVPPRYFSTSAAPPDLPPSYDDFIKSSDFYPPLLFSRARRGPEATAAHPSRFQHKPLQYRHGISPVVIPIPRESRSSPSQDLHSNPGSSAQGDAQRWTLRGTIGFRASLLRRPMSLDSNLDRACGMDGCYLYLSITRADRLLRRHTCGCSADRLEIENVDINIEGAAADQSTSRRYTWSVVTDLEAEGRSSLKLHCLLRRTQSV